VHYMERGNRRRERGSFGVNVGHPIVTICGIAVLCRKGGDAALPKLLWDFLLI